MSDGVAPRDSGVRGRFLEAIGELWRAFIGAPESLSGPVSKAMPALVVFLASLPFAGWRAPLAWLLLMFGILALEQWSAKAAEARPGALLPVSPYAWLVTCGYSVAAFYLVMFHTGAAQTLGVTLYGVVMFQILGRDYAEPKRLRRNMAGPLISLIAIQTAAAVLMIRHGVAWQIVTLLASPYIALRAFRVLQHNLVENFALERDARAQLAESEARYRLIAERSPDVIVRFDAMGRIQYLSPAARHYGWEPKDLRDVSLPNALHHSVLARNANMLAELASGGPEPKAADNIWRSRTPDGRSVVFEVRSNPTTDAQGRVTGGVAVLRDVTRRLGLEEKLEASEQKLRSLFELAPLGIAMTDMNRHYIEFNKAFCDICGYDEAELKTLDYWALTPRKYAEEEEKRRDSLKQTGRYGHYEKEYIRKDGSVVPVRLNGMLVEGPGGERYIWSIVENIEAQRRSEAVLIEARAAAETAAHAKSEFLATMSHEIRTPLTAVVGFAGLMEKMRGLPKEARHYAQLIATSADALLLVVNDVLDFSKLEAGQVELDPHPFDPRAFVAETVDLVRDRALQRSLVLDMQVAPDLPPSLLADSARLRQVLLNLLTNAVKFTETGGVTVQVTYDSAATRLRIAVKDSGIGIPKDRLDRLFLRFSQVDASNTRRYGGTGLGLAISKSIVELMDGRIGVDSRPGAGSTFWFEVAAPEADAVEAAHETQPGGDVEVDDLKILMVDDVAVNRELVTAMLSGFDIRIVEAAGGMEAVRAAMAESFDLILMDLQMPGMDGLAATEAIRHNSPLNARTPILALSANVLPAQIEECRRAGMDDHVAKPIQPKELLTKIVKWTQTADAA